MSDTADRDIVLASGSRARRTMLEAAGAAFRVVVPDVDEEAIRSQWQRDGSTIDPKGLARALARAKAEEVSRREPASIVIGGDQVLALGDELFTKPVDVAAARDNLKRLAGRQHQLHSAVTLAIGGRERWGHVGTALLDMREVSDAFLDDYLARVGDRVLGSVGAYELEGLGVQLFERIEGDFFTILGMPLLALLGELRARGALPR
jgi:septum formation protein